MPPDCGACRGNWRDRCLLLSLRLLLRYYGFYFLALPLKARTAHALEESYVDSCWPTALQPESK